MVNLIKDEFNEAVVQEAVHSLSILSDVNNQNQCVHLQKLGIRLGILVRYNKIKLVKDEKKSNRTRFTLSQFLEHIIV